MIQLIQLIMAICSLHIIGVGKCWNVTSTFAGFAEKVEYLAADASIWSDLTRSCKLLTNSCLLSNDHPLPYHCCTLSFICFSILLFFQICPVVYNGGRQTDVIAPWLFNLFCWFFLQICADSPFMYMERDNQGVVIVRVPFKSRRCCR